MTLKKIQDVIPVHNYKTKTVHITEFIYHSIINEKQNPNI